MGSHLEEKKRNTKSIVSAITKICIVAIYRELWFHRKIIILRLASLGQGRSTWQRKTTTLTTGQQQPLTTIRANQHRVFTGKTNPTRPFTDHTAFETHSDKVMHNNTLQISLDDSTPHSNTALHAHCTTETHRLLLGMCCTSVDHAGGCQQSG